MYGSLTITGSAELTKKLDCATGEFRSDGGETAARVSVVGSTVYKNVYELLKDGCGFKLYSIDPQQFVGGGDKTLMQDVEIGWHTHSYAGVEGEEYRECACGKTCSHEDGYHNDGTCAVCGKPCPHTNVDKSDYTCKGCGKQMCVKIQSKTVHLNIAQTSGRQWAMQRTAPQSPCWQILLWKAGIREQSFPARAKRLHWIERTQNLGRI